MKRNVKILLTMLLLAFTLVGCGEKKYEAVITLEDYTTSLKTKLTKDELMELEALFSSYGNINTEWSMKVLEKILEKYNKYPNNLYIEKEFFVEHMEELKQLNRDIRTEQQKRGKPFQRILEVDKYYDWSNYDEVLNANDNIEVKNLLEL
ncbi:hypothetical protein CSB08_01500 [Candidatus Gracilibacteria bacterium]|nr:MAG: hypothetical protein CSB08_01500 [Candidatus Gracilibacteria bacterium]